MLQSSLGLRCTARRHYRARLGGPCRLRGRLRPLAGRRGLGVEVAPLGGQRRRCRLRGGLPPLGLRRCLAGPHGALGGGSFDSGRRRDDPHRLFLSCLGLPARRDALAGVPLLLRFAKIRLLVPHRCRNFRVPVPLPTPHIRFRGFKNFFGRQPPVLGDRNERKVQMRRGLVIVPTDVDNVVLAVLFGKKPRTRRTHSSRSS